MEQYIPKSAVVAEIDRTLEKLYKLLPDASKVENGCINVSDVCNTGKYTALESFKDYVDSIEVKEMDLDSNIRTYLTNHFNIYEDGVLQSKKSGLPLRTYDIIKVAKHFFELGMRASNPLTWEDVNSINHLLFDIKEDYDNGRLDKEEYYTEVLKRFKAQKGE